MTLIVVLRDDQIEFALERAIEHGIAGDWPFDVDAFLLRGLDSRLDAFDFLAAENAAFTAMRIQAGDRDTRFVDAKFAEMLMSGTDGSDHPFDGRTFGGVLQRLVRGDMDCIELVACQQHERRLRSGQMRQQLGMAVEVVAGGMHGGLVQWSRDDHGNLATQSELDRFFDVSISGFAAGGGNLAIDNLVLIRAHDVEDRYFTVLRIQPVHELKSGAEQFVSTPQNRKITHHCGNRTCCRGHLGKRLDDDFRPNT